MTREGTVPCGPRGPRQGAHLSAPPALRSWRPPQWHPLLGEGIGETRHEPGTWPLATQGGCFLSPLQRVRERGCVALLHPVSGDLVAHVTDKETQRRLRSLSKVTS